MLCIFVVLKGDRRESMDNLNFFVDPESEYKELTKSFDGDWINATVEVTEKVIHLQIRPTPVDEDAFMNEMVWEIWRYTLRI